MLIVRFSEILLSLPKEHKDQSKSLDQAKWFEFIKKPKVCSLGNNKGKREITLIN